MKKKSQITLFILLGGVILIIIFFLFVMREYEAKTELGDFEDIKDINFFVGECLNALSVRGLEFMGLHGGFVEFPGHLNTITTSNTELPLHYDEGANNLPRVEDMESELSEYIEHEILLCIDGFNVFKERGYEFTEQEVNADVRIEGRSVYTEIDYPVEVKKGEEITTISAFNKNIPLKLERMHEFAEVVVNKALEYDEGDELIPDLDINSYIDDFELNYDYYPVGFQTIFWQVEGFVGEKPYYFIFSTRFRRELPHW
jgi:hypothetical protein